MNTTDTKHLFERFAAHKAKHAACVPYNAVSVPGISDESGTLNALKESDMPKSSERTDRASKSESKSETVSILARLSGVKQNDAENDAGESVRQIAESRGISGICEDSHFDLRGTCESVPAAASECESSYSENASAERRKRDRLRLHITTGQAALAITVLVAALCACIAMLISQSQNMNRLTAGMAWNSVSGTERSSSGTQSGNSQSASPQSLSSSAQTETDESGFESESENKSSSQSSSQIPSENSEQSSSSKLININKATSEQLQTLDGIGPSTAEKIISYRKSHGAFSSVDDLIEIPGIGTKTVEKLRNAVTVK